MSINTNWYVITGAPSSGKTKTIEYLAFLGYAAIPEASRILIDIERSKGKTTKEIRLDEAEFQRKVFQMKIETETRMSTEQLVFFDGGIPSSVAYYQLHDLDPAPVIEESRKRKYRTIFILDRLPFEKDYARVEDEGTVNKLDRLLYEAYSDLGYEVVRVPPQPIEERVKFILSKINQ